MRKLIGVVVFFPAIILGSCGPGANVDAVISNVKDGLIDPYSAQFEDIKVNDRLVCGKVNAKNRMGAFTGAETFLGYAGEDAAYSALTASGYGVMVSNIPDSDKAYLKKKFGTIDPFELNAECVVSGKSVTYRNGPAN